MSAADFAPIIQAIIAGIGLIITTLIGIYVPKAIAAFEARTHIALTAQQQATVMGAAVTAAGIIQTKIDQGALKIGHINVSDPTVLNEAAAAIARVPDAAGALNKSEASMAATIVGLVSTAPQTPVLLAAAPPVAIPPFPLIPKVTP